MPLYEYYCSDCRATFELLVSSSKYADDVVCKKCQGENTRRLLSVFAVPRGRSNESTSVTYESEAPTMGGCSCGSHCGCH